MTSTASHQHHFSAAESPATSANSHGFVAGAPPNASPSLPIMATASGLTQAQIPPIIVGPMVGSMAPVPHRPGSSPAVNKPSSGPPVVATPLISRGSSGNGYSADPLALVPTGPTAFHPNNSVMPGPKYDIRFGSDVESPALASNIPQGPMSTVPVPSPRESPKPIPVPSRSGGYNGPAIRTLSDGRPVAFGSMDPEINVAHPFGVPSPAMSHSSPHLQRDSPHIGLADMSGNPVMIGSGSGPVPIPGQGPGPAVNRSNYNPNYRGRGNYNHHGSQFMPYYHHQNRPAQNRGMAHNFAPQRASYQPNRSPAMGPAIPGTPNMTTANISPAQPQFHYATPPQAAAAMQPPQQVHIPSSICDPTLPATQVGKKPHRRDSEKFSRPQRQRDSTAEITSNGVRRRSRRDSQHVGTVMNAGNAVGPGAATAQQPAATPVTATALLPQPGGDEMQQPIPHMSLPPTRPPPSLTDSTLDLSPENGHFDKLLMDVKQNMNVGYPPPPPPQSYVGDFNRGLYYPGMPIAYGPPPTNGHGFQSGTAYMPANFHPPTNPMTRQPSHPEQRGSTTPAHPTQPVIVSSNTQQSSGKTSGQSSTLFVPPKRPQVTIKNSQGKVVDLSSLKAQPPSPAFSNATSRTPPIVESAATPPLKSTTPSHGRNESAATTKTTEEVRDELREKILQATKMPYDDKSKPNSPIPSPKKPPRKEESEVGNRDENALGAKVVLSANDHKMPTASSESALDRSTQPISSSADKGDTEKELQEDSKQELKKDITEQPNEGIKAEPKHELKEELKDELKEGPRGGSLEGLAEKPRLASREELKEVPATRVAADGPSKTEPLPDAKALADAEMDRIVKEIEEQEAEDNRREEEHRLKKKAQEEANKIRAEDDKKATLAEQDRLLRDAEREAERLEDEKEQRRNESENSGKPVSAAEALTKGKVDLGTSTPSQHGSPTLGLIVNVTGKTVDFKTQDSKAIYSSPLDSQPSLKVSPAAVEKRTVKPAALTLKPISAASIEAPQPSAALQSLQTARFLSALDPTIYPPGILSPNLAVNAAVAKKGKTFRYDANFLLQFQKVFTEQPSLEFSQQVKSLIGDSDGGRMASSKPASSGIGPRTTSRGPNVAPMGSFIRGGGGGVVGGGGGGGGRGGAASVLVGGGQGGFQGGNQARAPSGPVGAFRSAPFGGTGMGRTISQQGMPSPPGGRQSSRQGTRTRTERGGKVEPDTRKMPLTQGQDIKPLQASTSGWKSSNLGGGVGNKFIQGSPAGPNLLGPELVQRKVKAALNKMTPEKFDKISQQILEIAAQSRDETDGQTLRQVIQLTFEKATDEAHWASMYARFCRFMLDNIPQDIRDTSLKKNGELVTASSLFRTYLLNRCQEDFEMGWKTNLTEQKEGEDSASLEAVMLSEEYYVAAAAKRRGLGLVQFIGELYKLHMLTERIMHECVKKLVDYTGMPDEAEIESLCKLLRTVGRNLDTVDKGRPSMDAYFARIQQMIDIPELQSRLKFLLMDIIDLRRAHWVSKEANKGPKTLEEVRADAEAQQAQKAQEAARNSQRGGSGGGGGPGRPPLGRGDARAFSSTFTQPPSNNQVGMDDLRRLKGNASRSMTQGPGSLGPTSMFSNRSNSNRRLGPGGALGRPGEDSGLSSRTATPPREVAPSQINAFSVLANMESENPASPPSNPVSPALAKAGLDSTSANTKEEARR